MSLDSLVKYIMSLLSHFSVTILAFSLFRMTIDIRKILIIALILGTLSNYYRFVLDSPFFPVLNLFGLMIMLMVIKKYPVFYSFLVSSITFVVSNVIETLFVVIIFELEWTNTEKIQSSSLHFFIGNTSICTIYLLIAYLLRRYKLGFSLIIGNYKKISLKKYHLIWVGSLILFIFFVQMAISLQLLSFHQLVFVVFSISAIIALGLSYKQNTRELKERSLSEKKCQTCRSHKKRK